MNELVHYNTMRHALMQAHELDEVKGIRDRAAALRAYAKQAGEGLENQNLMAEIKIRAERRAGEILAETDRNREGRPEKLAQAGRVISEYQEVCKDADIPRATAERWQEVARIPEELFEEHLATKKENRQEITSAALLKLSSDILMAERRKWKNVTARSLPPTTYNVLYADPAWEYSNTGVHGAADHHYETMSTEKLKTLLADIEMRVDANAVLFLWATNPLLVDALEVVNAWGFQYKTNMVWVKTELKKPGSGFYVRGRHELLFICTRGNFTPLDQNISPPIGSIIESPVREHSRKPEEVYGIIERLYPGCNYIELFSRSARNGWNAWGNETEKFTDVN